MSKIWRDLVPDRYGKIANLLKADIAAPISPGVMMKEAKNLSSSNCGRKNWSWYIDLSKVR